VARSHQKICYNLLFRTAAAALQELAADPRFVGGQIGLIGVLHTWTRQLNYHPHVHYLVPAGALAPDGQSWQPARNGFLVHVKPLSVLFRAKFRQALKKTALFDLVPAEAWSKKWVVHCKPVGTGQAALKYLATYVFRVAISNNRLVSLADDQVTFRYKDSDTGKKRYSSLSAEEFIRRFLQHVLPKGFMKVRYYGLFSPSHRPRLKRVRQLLEGQQTAQAQDDDQTKAVSAAPEADTASSVQPICCPKCGQPMQLMETIQPKRERAP
jgi:hypothetical protein